MNNYITSRQLFTLSIVGVVVVAALLTVNVLSANWSAPSQTPPGGNVESPIHTGSAYQKKEGDLGAERMRSGQYCDEAGIDCIDYSDLGSGESCTTETQTVSTCGYGSSGENACPDGWTATGSWMTNVCDGSCAAGDACDARYSTMCQKVVCD